MKTQRTPSTKRGFTLMELMVAMAITTIIVTVLVSITSIALDTWNRSRAELRASRQAKSMLEVIARDFEALVTRRGNANEWLSAVVPTAPRITTKSGSFESSNAAELIFFTAATDRYDGEIGKATDLGGDVSCVAYKLEGRDPIGAAGGNDFETFVLSRLLVNPDKTFTDLLGKPDLKAAFATFAPKLSEPENFVCENIYQFTVTFHVQALNAATPPVMKNTPVTLGSQTTTFRILGTGIVTIPENTSISSGRITAVEISATVISDFGVDQLKRRPFDNPTAKAEFLAKNSYQYTKLVQLPSM
jgi:prepilin-type N-terminal cleavage/methylation domain-containing protein